MDQSGFTLATTAERDDLSLIAITLDSNFQSKAYDDTKKLLDYGFSTFTHSAIAKGTSFKIDNRTYQASEKLTFTHERNEQLTKRAEADGKLKVTDSHGETIASFQLKEAKKKNSKAMSPGTKENAILGANFSGFLIPAAGLVVMIIVLHSYRRKKRKDSAKKWILM